MNRSYDDIRHLPHPVSSRHAPMAPEDRAAQFAPFAALTGFEDITAEEARLTDSSIELTEGEMERLNKKIMGLADLCHTHPGVELVCFQPDSRKAGGAYITVRGNLKRLDEANRCLVLTDGRRIPLDSIYAAEKRNDP